MSTLYDGKSLGQIYEDASDASIKKHGVWMDSVHHSDGIEAIALAVARENERLLGRCFHAEDEVCDLNTKNKALRDVLRECVEALDKLPCISSSHLEIKDTAIASARAVMDSTCPSTKTEAT